MSFRIYLDDDSLAKKVVNGLRKRGISVLTTTEAKRPGDDDEKHLEYAAAYDLVLVTGNVRDFKAISQRWLSSNRSHSGIIIIDRMRLQIGEQVKRLERMHELVSAEEMRNNIEYLTSW